MSNPFRLTPQSVPLAQKLSERACCSRRLEVRARPHSPRIVAGAEPQARRRSTAFGTRSVVSASLLADKASLPSRPNATERRRRAEVGRATPRSRGLCRPPRPRLTRRRRSACSGGSGTRVIEPDDAVLGPCSPGVEWELPDCETVRAHVVEHGTKLAIEEPEATCFGAKVAKCCRRASAIT